MSRRLLLTGLPSAPLVCCVLNICARCGVAMHEQLPLLSKSYSIFDVFEMSFFGVSGVWCRGREMGKVQVHPAELFPWARFCLLEGQMVRETERRKGLSFMDSETVNRCQHVVLVFAFLMVIQLCVHDRFSLAHTKQLYLLFVLAHIFCDDVAM